MKAVLGSLLLLLLPACASGPDVYELWVVDDFARQVPCLLLINDEEPPARDFATFVNGPTRIAAEFSDPQEGLLLRLFPTRLDREGTPMLPDPANPSPYLPTEREIFASDPPAQIFILSRREQN
ncbi:MAG: hypothetical protein ACYTG5_13855 [Planctomycetota bacterium]|jgi:hypothetical protein